MTAESPIRCAGLPFQHFRIVFHVFFESSGWSGRLGRRPFNIEYTPAVTLLSENGGFPSKI